MTFGQRKDFFKGLDGLIGPPNPNLLEGMRWEHCERKDSQEDFMTSNSKIYTTSLVEFLVVYEPEVPLPQLHSTSKDLNSELYKQQLQVDAPPATGPDLREA